MSYGSAPERLPTMGEAERWEFSKAGPRSRPSIIEFDTFGVGDRFENHLRRVSPYAIKSIAFGEKTGFPLNKKIRRSCDSLAYF